MGRAVLGGRFEGTLKLSANLLIFCEPITVFGHRGLLRDANILRDSVLLRLSTLPERANIHVQSIILHQVWEELQARENLKDKDGRALDPIAVAGLIDKLWEVAETLTSPDDSKVLWILREDYCPFPPDERLVEWRDRRARQTVPTVDGTEEVPYYKMMGDLIRSFGPAQGPAYQPLLLLFLRLFGESIKESLTRSCSKLISHMDGSYSMAGAAPWMRALAPDLLSENDLAESAFAMVRLIVDLFLLWTSGCFLVSR